MVVIAVIHSHTNEYFVSLSKKISLALLTHSTTLTPTHFHLKIPRSKRKRSASQTEWRIRLMNTVVPCGCRRAPWPATRRLATPAPSVSCHRTSSTTTTGPTPHRTAAGWSAAQAFTASTPSYPILCRHLCTFVTHLEPLHPNSTIGWLVSQDNSIIWTAGFSLILPYRYWFLKIKLNSLTVVSFNWFVFIFINS